MKTIQFILLTILVLWAATASAQKPEKSGWAFSAGWTEAMIGDQHMSPLLYHSDVLTLESKYSIAKQSILEIGLQIQIGTNQAQQHRKRNGTFFETPSLFAPQESYDFQVNPFLSRFGGQLYFRALWPVGAYSQFGFKAQVRYDLAGMAGDTWQFALASIGPSYQYQRPVYGKGSAYFSAHLPLAAVVVRPNWAIDASLPDETNYFKGYLRTNTRFTSLNGLQNPAIRVGYIQQLPNNKSISLDYNLAWLSYAKPRPLRMLEHGLRLSYFL